MSLSFTEQTALPRRLCTQLFVPGNRPERFEKACASGADLICIDLEDAVGAQDKETARHSVLTWLTQTSHKNVSLRINGIDTQYGKDDVAAITQSGLSLPYIMIPKVDCKNDIDWLDDELPNALGPFFPIIETARGVLNARDIFRCSRVHLAMFGAVDYSADLNSDMSWEAHLYARSHLLTCAAAEDVTLFDAPHIKVKDLQDCEDSTRRAKALGFRARSAIHPAQLAPITTALYPSDTEIEEARKILAASEAAKGNVVLINGKFIEEPVIKSARKTLAFINL